VVFARAGLRRLDRRIVEQGDEAAERQRELKRLHREKGVLKKERAAFQADIAAGQTRCEELQMLKFGQLIDLEKLDKHSASKGEEELQAKLNLMDKQYRKEIRKVEKDADQLKEKLLQVTSENTSLLTRIADLGAQQFQLEKELNAGGGGGVAFADKGPTVRKEIEERNRLVSLVKLQAKELEAIKAEINLLRRKGGHIYAPAAPAPPADEGLMPPPAGPDGGFDGSDFMG